MYVPVPASSLSLYTAESMFCYEPLVHYIAVEDLCIASLSCQAQPLYPASIDIITFALPIE